jgi:hypothetical protein
MAWLTSTEAEKMKTKKLKATDPGKREAPGREPELDYEDFVETMQTWPEVDKLKGGQLSHWVKTLSLCKGRWVNAASEPYLARRLYAKLSAVLGLDLRCRGYQLLWNGAKLGLAEDRELTRCHTGLERACAQRLRLENQRKRTAGQFRSASRALSALERKLREDAIAALRRISPSFRATLAALGERRIGRRATARIAAAKYRQHAL